MSTQNILIIKHGALGDLIQATGVMKDIRFAYPNSTISLLTSQRYVSLMQRFKWIDQTIVDNRPPIWNIQAYFTLGKILKQQSFDLVIDLQNSDRTRLYHSWWFRHKLWIGRHYSAPHPASGLEGMIDLLKNHHIPTVYSQQPDLSWMLEDINSLFNKWQITSPYAVLIPGSSANNKEKRWPHYGELAKLLEDLRINVICIVGPDEVDLISSFNCKVLQNLDLFQLASLLKNANFVIGNDTGPSHIAAHIGAKGVAIFGPQTLAKRAQMTRNAFRSIEVKDLHAFSAESMLAWLQQQSMLEKA